MGEPIDPGPSPWDFDDLPLPEADCVASGADLEPATVLAAYRAGLFPMPAGRELQWWSPLDRGVLGPGDLHVSRSLRRSRNRFTITVDTDFTGVIDGCADPRRSGSWIDARIREAYLRLHDLGWAHSIETRDDEGQLVGGLYGLAIGGLFAGESMFHRATDASKVALMGLVEQMERVETWLVDTQWRTDHLASLGVQEIAREDYGARLPVLLASPSPW